MRFLDRIDAGRHLAALLRQRLTGNGIVVVGLPRGGVPVAEQVADALGAPLDVILVRKLGVPNQPELAAGALGEDGVRVLNDEVIRMAGVSAAALERVEARESTELERRIRRFRAIRPRVSLEGATVVVVDDGIATGATARAACAVARAHGASRVVLAVPVAPAGWEESFDDVADEVVAVATPERFSAVGQWYADFSAVTDDEVGACLRRAAAADRGRWTRAVQIPVGDVLLDGFLAVPPGATSAVVFVHGSGSSRHSRRNQFVAGILNDAGIATLLFDLLTVSEEAERSNVFDIELLTTRLVEVTHWLRQEAPGATRSIGYFGASTGAAAALAASTAPGVEVAAVVARGGRPDLAGEYLDRVSAPTLLVVGSRDHAVLRLNERALAQLRCPARLAVVPGATHLFEEPGTLQQAADLARDWFAEHLAP
jgi:putative phosphoribosyl transferase